MGSSSKNKGSMPAAPAKAAAPARPLHGDPLTWDENGNVKTWKPAPEPQADPRQVDPRQVLAMLQARGVQNSASDSRFGYPGIETGTYGGSDGTGSHASGGNAFGLGTAAGNVGHSLGNAGRSIGRALGIGDGKGRW